MQEEIQKYWNSTQDKKNSNNSKSKSKSKKDESLEASLVRKATNLKNQQTRSVKKLKAKA